MCSAVELSESCAYYNLHNSILRSEKRYVLFWLYYYSVGCVINPVKSVRSLQLLGNIKPPKHNQT